jgi:hypothetical protein
MLDDAVKLSPNCENTTRGPFSVKFKCCLTSKKKKKKANTLSVDLLPGADIPRNPTEFFRR